MAATGATVGGLATSTIPSAISASWARESVDADDARIIRAVDGKRCKNNSRTKALSGAGPESPSSCCIRRSNWEGFRSPSSSAVSSCCRRRCSEASVLLMRACFRWSYGLSRGGCKIRSLTSAATSGARAAMMWSKRVLCWTTPRHANWASTWANQIAGSAGQKGGILIVTAETELAAGCSGGGCSTGSSAIGWQQSRTVR